MSASTTGAAPGPVAAGEPRELVVLTAGLRQPSSTRLLADRLGEAAVAALERHGLSVVVHDVELRERAHDVTNMLLTGVGSAALRAELDAVARADAVVAVTPIFSGSYTGMFKNFMDVLDQGSLTGTPVLLGATAGTSRHSLALDHELRPLFAYLRAVVVPTGVFAATEDFGAHGGQDLADDLGSLGQRVDRAAEELAALVAMRGKKTVADAFADPTTSFTDLLRGI